MARIKNTHRSKRKYDERRSAATARNKRQKREASDLRLARMVERTRSLIGQKATIRTAHGPLTATVLKMTEKPSEAKRSGSYLACVAEDGETYSRPRSRIKV